MKTWAACVRVFVIAAALAIFALPATAAVLRVCADPDYLPFSNQGGEGFENKVADLVAKALGDTVEYTWASYRGQGGFSQFLASNLDAHKCDVVMDIPYGSQEELTTRPYYISSYVFVFKRAKNYDITSMDSPVLKTVRLGFEGDTPAEDGVKIRGMAPKMVFAVGDKDGQSPAIMLDALDSGRLDVLITWLPAIGAFLPEHPDLEVVPVPNDRSTGSPEQYAFPMSMGVRSGEQSLKNQLDGVIAQHQAQIESVLARSGVKLYTPKSPNLP